MASNGTNATQPQGKRYPVKEVPIANHPGLISQPNNQWNPPQNQSFSPSNQQPFFSQGISPPQQQNTLNFSPQFSNPNNYPAQPSIYQQHQGVFPSNQFQQNMQQNQPSSIPQNQFNGPQPNQNQSQNSSFPISHPPFQSNPTQSFPQPSFLGAIPFGGISNEAATQIGIQFGTQAISAGSVYVNQNVQKFVNIPQLKSYFNVSNFYVIHRLSLILFPFRHKNWQRLIKRSETNGQMEGYKPPREDVNAPDMYIPVMAFVTHVLVTGVIMGLNSDFHPEKLGIIASSALIINFLEITFIKFGCYLLSIGSEFIFMDILAYIGYKYVTIIVLSAASCFLGGYASLGITIYCSVALTFFLLRSLRPVVLPDSNPAFQLPQRRRSIHFLFGVAVVQILLSYALSVSSPAQSKAS